jgi:hypothetical protein
LHHNPHLNFLQHSTDVRVSEAVDEDQCRNQDSGGVLQKFMDLSQSVRFVLSLDLSLDGDPDLQQRRQFSSQLLKPCSTLNSESLPMAQMTKQR